MSMDEAVYANWRNLIKPKRVERDVSPPTGASAHHPFATCCGRAVIKRDDVPAYLIAFKRSMRVLEALLINIEVCDV